MRTHSQHTHTHILHSAIASETFSFICSPPPSPPHPISLSVCRWLLFILEYFHLWNCIVKWITKWLCIAFVHCVCCCCWWQSTHLAVDILSVLCLKKRIVYSVRIASYILQHVIVVRLFVVVRTARHKTPNIVFLSKNCDVCALLASRRQRQLISVFSFSLFMLMIIRRVRRRQVDIWETISSISSRLKMLTLETIYMFVQFQYRCLSKKKKFEWKVVLTWFEQENYFIQMAYTGAGTLDDCSLAFRLSSRLLTSARNVRICCLKMGCYTYLTVRCSMGERINREMNRELFVSHAAVAGRSLCLICETGVDVLLNRGSCGNIKRKWMFGY